MAGTMKDYLSTAVADYSTVQFNVDPKRIMEEMVSFNQDAFEFDDESVAVLTRSTTPIFKVKLMWPYLNDTDAATIFDFYCDPLKAKGKARSFEWPHPLDGNTYICHFWDDLTQTTEYFKSVKNLTLKVIGYKA